MDAAQQIVSALHEALATGFALYLVCIPLAALTVKLFRRMF